MAIDALTAYRTLHTQPQTVQETEEYIDRRLQDSQWAATANARKNTAGELEFHFPFGFVFSAEEKRVLQELYSSWTVTFTEASGTTLVKLIATNIKL